MVYEVIWGRCTVTRRRVNFLLLFDWWTGLDRVVASGVAFGLMLGNKNLGLGFVLCVLFGLS